MPQSDRFGSNEDALLIIDMIRHMGVLNVDLFPAQYVPILPENAVDGTAAGMGVTATGRRAGEALHDTLKLLLSERNANIKSAQQDSSNTPSETASNMLPAHLIWPSIGRLTARSQDLSENGLMRVRAETSLPTPLDPAFTRDCPARTTGPPSLTSSYDWINVGSGNISNTPDDKTAAQTYGFPEDNSEILH